ncbi:hypothetical protein [Desulfosediminicola sp.]|uniref:hypothetical protein n=1 Tax=Desulfosediminicola sp. TaxID=2886825 RepID=UPI003AF2D0FF
MCKLKFVFLFLLTIFIVPLYVLVGTTPAGAGIFPGLDQELCMADAYVLAGNSLSQGKLNCTANDVEITRVIPIDADGDRATLPDGSTNPDYDPVQCTLGETFPLNADITIRTNANERWDTTFYLPLTEQSPQVVQNNDPNCSIVLPNAWDIEGAPVEADLDSDQCSDITKASGTDEYTLEDETITMFCVDEDGDQQADFTYCAAWDNQERDNCTGDVNTPALYYGQIPNTKSKCKCDTFNIPVFIAPEPPIITKTVTPLTGTEPYQDFVYTITIKPAATTASSIFIKGLYDIVSSSTNSDGPYTFALNNGNGVGPGNSDVGLTQSYWQLLDVSGTTCDDQLDLTGPGLEIPPGHLGVTCDFVIRISDDDLPDIPDPELFQDFVQVKVFDENGAPVGNNDCSSAATGNCSNEKEVSLTNQSPSITVTKTPSTTEVLEPGGNVTFDVVVTSTSGSYDDPLVITELSDTDFGDLTAYPGSTCATGGDLFLGSPYSCSFTAFIAGNAGDVHNNTVTAKAIDNENDEATATDMATVNINDVPSNITLTKTADPTEVLETGDDPNLFRDVDYTFEFCVNAAGVDDVTFSSLIDEAPPESGNFMDLTADCSVDTLNGGAITPTPLLGFTLSPGDCASCEIPMQLQGNAGDIYENLATIYGQDEDGQDVMASDDETVTFLNAPLDITPEFAIKARAFLRLTNGGVDDATITTLTIKNTNLVDGAGSVAAGFEILDETYTYSYDTGDGPYEFCAANTVIAAGDTYECAFTIKLYPGFLPADADVNFSALGLDGVAVTLDDGDVGSIPVTETIGIEVFTVE